MYVIYGMHARVYCLPTYYTNLLQEMLAQSAQSYGKFGTDFLKHLLAS